jgi:hypothetical protein
VTGHRRIILLLFLLTFSATAQVVPRGPKVVVILPVAVPSDKVDLQGYLYGTFGAFGVQDGQHVRVAQNIRSLEIETVVKGKVADRLKLLAWAPGCKIATFDILLQQADVQEFFSCNALSTVTLAGRISASSQPQNEHAEIDVHYLAYWACGFFGLLDCEVPMILIGTATPDTDGRFEIRLPDFAADSTSSRPGGAEFDFMLREVKTGNPITWLWPESPLLRGVGGLKPAPSYPRPTVFDVRKPARANSAQTRGRLPT